MDNHHLPIADRSTVWLAGLIEATEAVAAVNKPCDPDTVKAFSDRLAMRADVRPLLDDFVRMHFRW